MRCTWAFHLVQYACNLSHKLKKYIYKQKVHFSSCQKHLNERSTSGALPLMLIFFLSFGDELAKKLFLILKNCCCHRQLDHSFLDRWKKTVPLILKLLWVCKVSGTSSSVYAGMVMFSAATNWSEYGSLFISSQLNKRTSTDEYFFKKRVLFFLQQTFLFKISVTWKHEANRNQKYSNSSHMHAFFTFLATLHVAINNYNY